MISVLSFQPYHAEKSELIYFFVGEIEKTVIYLSHKNIMKKYWVTFLSQVINHLTGT